MYGEVFKLDVNGEAKQEAKNTEKDADHQQLVAADSQELYGRQVGNLQSGFASGSLLARLGQSGGCGQGEKCRNRGTGLGKTAA